MLPKKGFLIAGGIGLVALGAIISPIPGPGGLPVMLLGAVVILRNSQAMRRRWIKLRRRWPGAVGTFDSLMRGAARRRRKAATHSG